MNLATRLTHAGIGLEAILSTAFIMGGCSPQRETRVPPANPYWELAWKAANTIPSPLDAGMTKARICEAAALSGQTGLLEKWSADEHVLWVKVSCDISHAYAQALYGKVETYEALIRTAVTAAKQIDEWDQSRITAPLMKAHIAELWQKSQDFEATKKWILEDDVKRMPVAAQLFCDWLTLHRQHAKSDITRETNVVQIIDLLMAQRNKYLPAERVRLFAELSPLMKGTSWESTVRQEIGDLEKATPKLESETLLKLSRIYSGLGMKEKADELISRAQVMSEAKDTGDCLAPWAMLAEAKAAAGRSREEINQDFDLGISRSNDRPGYFKPVAEALTYALRARQETPAK